MEHRDTPKGQDKSPDDAREAAVGADRDERRMALRGWVIVCAIAILDPHRARGNVAGVAPHRVEHGVRRVNTRPDWRGSDIPAAGTRSPWSASVARARSESWRRCQSQYRRLSLSAGASGRSNRRSTATAPLSSRGLNGFRQQSSAPLSLQLADHPGRPRWSGGQEDHRDHGQQRGRRNAAAKFQSVSAGNHDVQKEKCRGCSGFGNHARGCCNRTPYPAASRWWLTSREMWRVVFHGKDGLFHRLYCSEGRR